MVVTADDCFVTKFDNSWDRDNTDILCRCLDSACNVIDLVCVFFTGDCCTLLQTFSEVTNGSFTPVKLPVGCYSSSATPKNAKLFAEVKILS